MTAVGFEPTPLRNGALSHRLTPLGQTVLTVFIDWQGSLLGERPYQIGLEWIGLRQTGFKVVDSR